MKRWICLLCVAVLAACDQKMIDQQKDEVYEESRLYRNAQVNQWPVAGTVARGDLERAAVLATRPPMTMALLERGRERYTIYCAPCHGHAGYGDGIIVARGMPSPPSYHLPRLMIAPDSHFLGVIENGFGVMYSYAARVDPADRWAIVAYIRALQTSQAAPAADLPPALRARLTDAAPPRQDEVVRP